MRVGTPATRPASDLAAATGLIILPGVVDTHTHFIQDDPDLFDPDPDEHEGFEAGGRGAAAGGVTTVVEMPQARPPTVDGATFERKRALAGPGAVVDFALWGGVVQSTTAGQIDEQIAAGAAGLKAFMCNSDPSFPGVLFIVPGDHRARRIAGVIADQPPEARGLFRVTTEAAALTALRTSGS